MAHGSVFLFPGASTAIPPIPGQIAVISIQKTRLTLSPQKRFLVDCGIK
jgi:hypothetical protein